MSEHCEAVRDLLPDLVADRLSGAQSALVHEHVASCQACADELDLVRSIRADAVVLPVQLEGRVLNALRSDRRPSWFTPGRAALAAPVAFALLTATMLDFGGEAEPGETPDIEALAPPPWPSADEPLMRGGPALNQLSLDELESLLKELES
jgi:hypothetical protein